MIKIRRPIDIAFASNAMRECQRVTKRNEERERARGKMARKKRRDVTEGATTGEAPSGGREEEEKEGKGRDHGPRKVKREERRLNLTGVKLTLVGSPCIQYGDFLIESGWLLLRRSTDHRGKYLRMRASSRVKATYVTKCRLMRSSIGRGIDIRVIPRICVCVYACVNVQATTNTRLLNTRSWPGHISWSI